MSSPIRPRTPFLDSHSLNWNVKGSRDRPVACNSPRNGERWELGCLLPLTLFATLRFYGINTETWKTLALTAEIISCAIIVNIIMHDPNKMLIIECVFVCERGATEAKNVARENKRNGGRRRRRVLRNSCAEQNDVRPLSVHCAPHFVFRTD